MRVYGVMRVFGNAKTSLSVCDKIVVLGSDGIGGGDRF
jgi:hypothetical protein